MEDYEELQEDLEGDDREEFEIDKDGFYDRAFEVLENLEERISKGVESHQRVCDYLHKVRVEEERGKIVRYFQRSDGSVFVRTQNKGRMGFAPPRRERPETL